MKFKVYFTLYQYNSGAADNGLYGFSQSFKTLDEAVMFYRKLEYWKSNPEINSEEYHDFIESYVWDGYIDSIDKLTRFSEIIVDF